MTQLTKEELLHELLSSGKLNSSDIAQVQVNKMINEVKEIHAQAIYTLPDGRLKTYVGKGAKRKQIVSSTENGLYEKLYDYYFSRVNSVADIFRKWQSWAKKDNLNGQKPISDCSYKEYCRIYKKYVAKTNIAKMDIKGIRLFTLQDFIDSYNGLSKQEMGNIKTLFSHLYKQAMREQIEVHNLTLDIQINSRKCSQTDDSNNVFSMEDMTLLKQHMVSLENPNVYDLALTFALELPCRIGEIKAIQWCDIADDTVYIHKQITSEQQLKPVKGNTEKGNRYIPLSNTALSVLKKVRMMNPFVAETEYVFTINGEWFRTDCFDRALRRHCKQTGIKYYSSHKIRFYNASLLYINEVPIKDIQYYLGHTTQAMTEHYLRNIISKHERSSANAQYMAIFNKSTHGVLKQKKNKMPRTDNIVQFQTFPRGANQI